MEVSVPAIGRLRLGIADSVPDLVVEDPQLVVAGFTGRDPGTVAAHIAELQSEGIECPPAVPVFYQLPNWILRIGDGRRTTQVAAGTSSGEVEPVLIVMPDGSRYVTVGSDQTDRDFERRSIHLSKLVCPKFLAPYAWRFEDVSDRWDELRLRSYVGESRELYQEGALADLLRPHDIIDRCRALLHPSADRPLMLFLGTVPLRGSGFSFDQRFEGELYDEERGRALTCAYRLETIGVASAPASTSALA